MTSNYKCTFNLKGDESTGVTQKQMPNPREQYGDIVHLFIGARHSPYKITFMPFTFDNNSIVVYRGLNSLFIFKSVSFSATTPKLSCFTSSALYRPSYYPGLLLPRYRFESEGTCSHIILPEILLNPVFEDLRKPKAPNRCSIAFLGFQL
jgi:hypothetical protein